MRQNEKICFAIIASMAYYNERPIGWLYPGLFGLFHPGWQTHAPETGSQEALFLHSGMDWRIFKQKKKNRGICQAEYGGGGEYYIQHVVG
jgi:hypothetical protein